MTLLDPLTERLAEDQEERREEAPDTCYGRQLAQLYQQQQLRSELALLARLQEMVPIMPRERELTKLEIINYVIDYIRQLKELVLEEEEEY